MLTRRRRSEVVRCEGTTSGGHRTESQHGLVDLAGGLLTQEARVVALDGEQGHDPWRKPQQTTIGVNVTTRNQKVAKN